MQGGASQLASNFESESEISDSKTSIDDELIRTEISFDGEALKNDFIERDAIHDAYLAVINVKHLLSDVQGFEAIWPPTAADYYELADNNYFMPSLPIALFNMLAWMVGA